MNDYFDKYLSDSEVVCLQEVSLEQKCDIINYLTIKYPDTYEFQYLSRYKQINQKNIPNSMLYNSNLKYFSDGYLTIWKKKVFKLVSFKGTFDINNNYVIALETGFHLKKDGLTPKDKQKHERHILAFRFINTHLKCQNYSKRFGKSKYLTSYQDITDLFNNLKKRDLNEHIFVMGTLNGDKNMEWFKKECISYNEHTNNLGKWLPETLEESDFSDDYDKTFIDFGQAYETNPVRTYNTLRKDITINKKHSCHYDHIMLLNWDRMWSSISLDKVMILDNCEKEAGPTKENPSDHVPITCQIDLLIK